MLPPCTGSAGPCPTLSLLLLAWHTRGTPWAGAPARPHPSGLLGGVGEEKADLPSPAAQLLQRPDSPELSPALQFSESSVPHHSRLVTNCFLSSCITYTTEKILPQMLIKFSNPYLVKTKPHSRIDLALNWYRTRMSKQTYILLLAYLLTFPDMTKQSWHAFPESRHGLRIPLHKHPLPINQSWQP